MSKVIIDGVDVSECEHFKINRGFNCYKGYNCTDKECSDCYYKQLQRLQAENKTLERTSNELRKRYSEDTTKLSAELQRYKDMAKKGLEEFKDVGGCWGCGLQLQLNQDIEDIKQLKAENERLKLSERDLSRICQGFKKDIETEKSYSLKYYKTLQEIKAIAENQDLYRGRQAIATKILKIITKAEEENEQTNEK